MEKNNKDELVSIITHVYKDERFVEETIKSVQSQTYTNWEMILVDDCSKDRSNVIIENLKKKDKRIKYIKLEKNEGVAIARNIGILRAKGRYIAFLDSDDLWHNDKLEKQLKFMKKNEIGFSFTSYEIIDGKSIKTGKVKIAPKEVNYNNLLKQNVIGCLTVMIDRKKHNINFEKIRHEDYAAWLKILVKNNIAYGIKEILASYRKTNNSLSGNKFKSAIWTWNIYRKKENLNIFKCIYCFFNYAIKSMINI